LEFQDFDFNEPKRGKVARDVGFEPTRPFDHRLSRQEITPNWANSITLGFNAQSQHKLGLWEPMTDFKTFCEIDLQLSSETAKQHRAKIKAFKAWLDDRELSQITIRQYLALFLGKSPCTYANQLKALKVYCRDYLRQPQLVETFKFPNIPAEPKTIKTKRELRKFYTALEGLKDKSLFLLYATSGLRRQEGLRLLISDINLKNGLVTPKPHSGKTKHTWLTFFNEECAKILKEYLASRKDLNPKLYPMSRVEEEKLWHYAVIKTGIKITPQDLRDWFCEELGNNGMQDRYIDALCGRIPKKVLAKHYSDYAATKMLKRYRKARIKVLSK